MRTACVQFQPDRALAYESRIRQAFQDAIPKAQISAGVDNVRYENIVFPVHCPEEALAKIRAVLDSPDVGVAARSSCMVMCEGNYGWDDYLLLHHFDPKQPLYGPGSRPAG